MSSYSSSSMTADVPLFPKRIEGFDHYKIMMELYFQIKGWNDVVKRGVKNIQIYVTDDAQRLSKNTVQHGKTSKKDDDADSDEESPKQSKSSQSSQSSQASNLLDQTDELKMKSLQAAFAILKSIGDEQRMLISHIYSGNAHMIWKTICEKYNILQTPATKSNYYKQLMNVEKHSDESIHIYFARVINLRVKLHELQQYVDDSLIKEFILNGLEKDTNYKNHIIQIRTNDSREEWTSDQVEQYLISVENNMNIKKSSHNNNNNNAYYTDHRNNNMNNNNKKCDICDKTNHTTTECYKNPKNINKNKLNTKPGESNNNNNSTYKKFNKNKYNNNTNKSSVECHLCHKKGHKKDDCWHNPKNKNKHNNTKTDENNSNNNTASAAVESEDEEAFVTIDTSSHMLTHTNEHACTSSTTTHQQVKWIVDSAATNHFTNNKKLLYDMKSLSSTGHIKTANNKLSYNEVGTVKLNINNRIIIADNVAYVPSFKMNLLSVSRLYDDEKIGVDFCGTATMYECGDQHKVITKIDRVNSLYIVTTNMNDASVNNTHTTLINSDVDVMNNNNIDSIHQQSMTSVNNNLHQSVNNLLHENDDESDNDNDIEHKLNNELNKLHEKYDDEQSNSPTPSAQTNQINNTKNTYMNNDNIELKLINELKHLHVKYGHVSHSKLVNMINTKSVDGMNYDVLNMNDIKKYNILEKLKTHMCDGCMKGKMTRTSKTGVIDYNAHQVMDTWAGDTTGPMRIETLGGMKYSFNIVDVHSRYVFAMLLKLKSDATRAIKELIIREQTQQEKTLKRLHSDGGGEINNNEMKEYLNTNGTIYTITTPHTPQHNICERMNRTLFEMVKCMLHHAHAYVPLWGEAVITAVYIMNRTVRKGDPIKTPYELYYNKKPNIKHLHVFGCDVYYHINKVNRAGKLDQHGELGIFCGYNTNNDSYYRIYDIQKHKVRISSDVKFYDDNFTAMKTLNDEMKNEKSLNTNQNSNQNQIKINENDYLNIDFMSINQLNEMFSNINNEISKIQLTMILIIIKSLRHSHNHQLSSSVKNNQK
jgi:hypothetical protein